VVPTTLNRSAIDLGDGALDLSKFNNSLDGLAL
jgi:hypothetical protein